MNAYDLRHFLINSGSCLSHVLNIMDESARFKLLEISTIAIGISSIISIAKHACNKRKIFARVKQAFVEICSSVPNDRGALPCTCG